MRRIICDAETGHLHLLDNAGLLPHCTRSFNMTIKNVLQQLETSSHPVAKSLHKGAHFNLLVIGFKKGMRLNEHKAGKPSRLTVIQGAVVYDQGGERIQLGLFDEQEIPVNKPHAVEALEDSLCILSQGS